MDEYSSPKVQTSFIAHSSSSFDKNNISAINNSVFVTSLLASDRISEFSKDSIHVINPLSVSTQSSGKRRLILDLRFVNQFILKQKVKFEDYKTALDLFQYGGYACSFDLKNGYHHVDIFPSHQRFLGFSWTFPDGRIRYFAYTVLPFGLSSAPYLYTKLVRPLVKYWRSRGLYCIVYLDDGLHLRENPESFTSGLRRFSCLWFRDKSGKEHLVPSTVNCLAGYCLEF